MDYNACVGVASAAIGAVTAGLGSLGSPFVAYLVERAKAKAEAKKKTGRTARH